MCGAEGQTFGLLRPPCLLPLCLPLRSLLCSAAVSSPVSSVRAAALSVHCSQRSAGPLLRGAVRHRAGSATPAGGSDGARPSRDLECRSIVRCWSSGGRKGLQRTSSHKHTHTTMPFWRAVWHSQPGWSRRDAMKNGSSPRAGTGVGAPGSGRGPIGTVLTGALRSSCCR